MNPGKKKKQKNNQGNQWYGIIGVLALTAIIFSNSFTNNFLSLDDTEYIRDNPFILSLSITSIAKIFTSFYNANYHPLTTLVYAIQFKFFQLNAAPYHIINVFGHLANVFLVYILIKNLSGKESIALITALFFGIHPMHVESVAWVSEQKDVLYSFFYLLGLIVYLRYVKQNGLRQLALTFLLFLLALLSKSAAITFPLLLVLTDYYKERKWNRKVLMEKIPFFLLSLLFVVVTLYSQQSAGAINTDEMPHYAIGQRFFVVSYALVFYIIKLFIPTDLSALHYAPKELSAFFYISPLIIAILVWLALKGGTMKKQIVFGLLFYLLSIILVVQIVPVGAAIVSERYSYIPYIGLFFIAGSFYNWAAEKKIASLTFISPYLNYIIIVIALLFAILSYNRNKVWINDNALFTDIALKNPSSASAQSELGNVLNAAGDYPTALIKYNRAIELDSAVAETYFNRGNAYYHLKNRDEALKDYHKAIQLKHNYAEVLFNIGTIYAEQGNVAQALDYFNQCIAIKPNEFMYNSRATSYYFLQKYDEAIADYTQALNLNATLTEVYFNRGLAYNAIHKNTEACNDWKTAQSMGYPKATQQLDLYCK